MEAEAALIFGSGTRSVTRRCTKSSRRSSSDASRMSWRSGATLLPSRRPRVCGALSKPTTTRPFFHKKSALFDISIAAGDDRRRRENSTRRRSVLGRLFLASGQKQTRGRRDSISRDAQPDAPNPRLLWEEQVLGAVDESSRRRAPVFLGAASGGHDPQICARVLCVSCGDDFCGRGRACYFSVNRAGSKETAFYSRPSRRRPTTSNSRRR